MAGAGTQDADIRKFEEIGTHPAANHNAIAEALTFPRQASASSARRRGCATCATAGRRRLAQIPPCDS